jgi:hypothetical protein
VRSLADDVRARTDEELRDLLLRRPDLARPAPSDLTALAARATTRASTIRAVDALDQGHIDVLEAATLAEAPLDPGTVAGLLGTDDQPAVRRILEELWLRALLWRGPDGLRVVRTVGEALGPYPAGLGPSFADLSASPLDLRTLPALVDAAPSRARAILDRLTWGPPVGVLPEAVDGPGPVDDGARWLVAAGLLVATAPDQVVLPREVGMALRSGRVHRTVRLDRPQPRAVHYETGEVDAVAGVAASELLAGVDELLAAWSADPPRVLRGGGLAARALTLTARGLDVDVPHAALLVEVAYAAGLLDDDAEADPSWAPTAAYDRWRDEPGGVRWADLATGWLTSTRAPHLVGRRDGDDRAVNALSPDVHWPAVVSLRHDILAVLADLPPGSAAEVPDIASALAWWRPRRLPRESDPIVRAILAEADALGVVGRGALGSAGRVIVDAGAELRGAAAQTALAAAMHPHLPAPIDKILLQADLTAVAPGPVTGALADLLRLVADVESRGGATVHRFGQTSIRRALDAGWSADQILGALADASRTPVPQPLDYLVRDAARRHGQVRVGGARTYVRADAESTLDEMLATRDLTPLQLRRIAPTVLVSPVGPDTALDMLRDAGFAPAAEAPSGVVAVARVSARRSAARRGPAEVSVRTVDAPHATELARALRAGEAAAEAATAGRTGPAIPSGDPTTSVAVLREAIAGGYAVWLGYADGSGRVRRVLFSPRRIDGGRVTGTVEGTTHTLSVHRISGVVVE